MKNMLVTGAAGGMGRAGCRALAGEGYRVFGIDRAEPEDFPSGAVFIPADVTRAADLEAALERVRGEAGQLHGVVHTAGVYDLNSLVEMPEEDFIRDFDVNVFGVFRVNCLFLPLFAPASRVVVISSELAPLRPLPFTGIYAVTKAAVDRYAAALRMELQLLGHRVCVIRPGAVRTGMLDVSTRKLDRFCAETRLYAFGAKRFLGIVRRVEARSVPPERIAAEVLRALGSKRPRSVYAVNRNPLLLLFDLLPDRTHLWLIRKILS